MKFHTVATVTNGVLPVHANMGQLVEWTSVLTDLNTGEHHRTVDCAGHYDGCFIEEQTGWLYALFSNGRIGDKPQEQFAMPQAWFR